MRTTPWLALLWILTECVGFSQAILFTNDFNVAAPPGATLYGNAAHVATGGVGNSGMLRLTDAVNSQMGTMALGPGVQASALSGFTARFKVRIGPGSVPTADGFSFCWANDLPAGAISEEGAGTGLIVSFDTFPWPEGGEVTPTIDIRYKGQLIATRSVHPAFLETAGEYVDVLIHLKPEFDGNLGALDDYFEVPDPNNPPAAPDPNQVVADPPEGGFFGRLDVVYNNVVIYNNLRLDGYDTALVGQFAIGARTGGLNAVHAIDDMLVTTVDPDRLTILRHPRSLRGLAGASTVFSVLLETSLVEETVPVSYQWIKDGTPIQNATNATFAVGPFTAADHNTGYQVLVFSATGAELSRTGTIQIVDVPKPTKPSVTYDFNSGETPPETHVHGTAHVAPNGGVNDSGVLRVTEKQPSQLGSMIIDKAMPGKSFITSFRLYIEDTSGTPADGFSFALGNFGDNPFWENGPGGGLAIGFDNYDNSGGDPNAGSPRGVEAPAINVLYDGRVLETVSIPLADLVNNKFVDVVIRVRENGNLDVVHNGIAIYYDYPLAYPGLANARFAVGGRTGGAMANHWIDDWVIEANFVPYVPPLVKITSAQLNGNILSLDWVGGGMLQTAIDPAGPWVNQPGLVSPQDFVVDDPAEPVRFFRVVR